MNRIKQLREESKMTQAELSKKLDVARSTICAYEADAVAPPYEKIVQLSKIFGVSVKYLTGESETKNDVILGDDVADQIATIIEQLRTNKGEMTFQGKKMSPELKEATASQLEAALKTILFISSSNKV